MSRIAWLLFISAIVIPVRASAEPIKIHNQQVLLNVDDPSVTRIGRLRYRGGVSLSSDDPRFGGLSGLLVDRGGQRFKAVSDKGTWLTAKIVHDSNRRLIGVEKAEIAGMRDRAGKVVKGKKFGDAEAMARVNGHVVVAYEHTHRLWHFADRGNFLDGRPRIERRPPRGRKHSRVLRRNHGIEALTELSGNRLFALPEGRKDAVVRQPGWIIDGKRWHPVTYARKGPVPAGRRGHAAERRRAGARTTPHLGQRAVLPAGPGAGALDPCRRGDQGGRDRRTAGAVDRG